MSLLSKETKAFRTIGHKLKPVVIISTRLNDNIHNEIDRALKDHELIKIKVNVPDRDDKKAIITELAAQHQAEIVQIIGKVALFYRQARKQNVKLSNLVRHQNLLGS